MYYVVEWKEKQSHFIIKDINSIHTDKPEIIVKCNK